MKVGFAGSGNMAAAMARGWAGADGGPELMLFTDSGSGRAGELAAELGGEAMAGNGSLAEMADLVILCVKPKDLEDVAADIGTHPPPVVSVLGATSLATLENAFPDTTVFRLMPNLGVEVRRGVICLATPEGAAPELRTELLELLELLGMVVELDEGQMDAATAVMGCSPAYFALVVEAIAAAGAAQGLDPRQSLELVIEAMAGTAELLRAHDPDALRRAVGSPGGSTEAGLEALERAGAAGALMAAVDASLERMRG